MKGLRTIDDIKGKLEKSDSEFNFQKNLTDKLDSGQQERFFDQQLINEIILWKVNRYAHIDDKTIQLLNSINKNAIAFEMDLTREILKMLLKIKGINLPVASTILRFSNPLIYQIIDQRVYRLLYRCDLKLKANTSDKGLSYNIELYLGYLKKIRDKCTEYKIEFAKSDRLLFNVDKRINKEFKIKY